MLTATLAVIGVTHQVLHDCRCTEVLKYVGILNEFRK